MSFKCLFLCLLVLVSLFRCWSVRNPSSALTLRILGNQLSQPYLQLNYSFTIVSETTSTAKQSPIQTAVCFEVFILFHICCTYLFLYQFTQFVSQWPFLHVNIVYSNPLPLCLAFSSFILLLNPKCQFISLVYQYNLLKKLVFNKKFISKLNHMFLRYSNALIVSDFFLVVIMFSSLSYAGELCLTIERSFIFRVTMSLISNFLALWLEIVAATF